MEIGSCCTHSIVIRRTLNAAPMLHINIMKYFGNIETTCRDKKYAHRDTVRGDR